jgi:radical SAM superfamily enzyme YgiQ (UPF0313 family)
MQVFLVNPSNVSFGIAVITPRWMFVLAGATPEKFGTPVLIDETLERMDFSQIKPGDVVGVSVHTGNALRGYEVGKAARAAGATVIYGGIHATLFPDEAIDAGQGHSIVSGDGDLVWGRALDDAAAGQLKPRYDGGRVPGDAFVPARWDLLPPGKYMWASVQTVRGCPKHCSFCSVWRTDGQEPRMRNVDVVLKEIVELRRKGFRFIALADDNFYPVAVKDLEMAARRADKSHLHELEEMRAERFDLMARLAKLPQDTIFFTQITMEAAEDPEFLDAMRKANIKGALVGVEAVTPEGLKDIYKDFNLVGEELAKRLRVFREHGVHVLGSFIFGLPSDTAATFDATAALAEAADITFAQFVMLTPFPGTIDFDKWAAEDANKKRVIDGVPVTTHWLIPMVTRPKLFVPHPKMTFDEIRDGTQGAWDQFYSWSNVWERSRVVKSYKGRVAFVMISKLYRQMYANTGIATDSARVKKSTRWARWLGLAVRRLFLAPPMPNLQMPEPTVPARETA